MKLYLYMKRETMKKIISAIGILCLGLMSFKPVDVISASSRSTLRVQEEIVIEGVGVSKTVETTGKETIRIEGTNNKITIVGGCTLIKIEGVDNTVIVDDVKKVNIEGTGNKVNYKKSSNADGNLKSSISGVNNKITKG